MNNYKFEILDYANMIKTKPQNKPNTAGDEVLENLKDESFNCKIVNK